MILIIGGAYQGKMAFAEQLLEEQKKNGKAGSIFPQFHMWVKAHMEADANDKISEHVNSNEKNDKFRKRSCGKNWYRSRIRSLYAMSLAVVLCRWMPLTGHGGSAPDD